MYNQSKNKRLNNSVVKIFIYQPRIYWNFNKRKLFLVDVPNTPLNPACKTKLIKKNLEKNDEKCLLICKPNSWTYRYIFSLTFNLHPCKSINPFFCKKETFTRSYYRLYNTLTVFMGHFLFYFGEQWQIRKQIKSFIFKVFNQQKLKWAKCEACIELYPESPLYFIISKKIMLNQHYHEN